MTPPDEDIDGGPGLLCSANKAVFDLTQMGLATEMPESFVEAWDFEVGNPYDETKPPALLLAGKNLRTGPVEFRIGGAVVVNGANTVPAAGNGTASLQITPNPMRANAIERGRVAASFKLAFGPASSRRTITATAVEMDLESNADCSTLAGWVKIEIPGTNGDVVFGNGTTLAGVLGAPNTDTDGDTQPDGWTLSFLSNRGLISTVGLTP